MMTNMEQLQRHYGLDEPRKYAFADPSFTSATSSDSSDSLSDDMSEILSDLRDNKRTMINRTKSFDLYRRGNKVRRDAPQRSVSFGKVQVRTYERVLSDSIPTCTPGGPSLGLGWNFVEKKPIEVDKHERKGSLFAFTKSRRQRKDFLMTAEKRLKMAEKLGFTEDEIVENARTVDRVVRQRRRSVQAFMQQQNDAVFLMQAAQIAHFGRV